MGDPFFTTSGPDGISQAAGRIMHMAATEDEEYAEGVRVVGIDLGGAEAQGLRAALGHVGVKVHLLLFAVQRLGAGESPHAAAVAGLAIRQWGTRAAQALTEVSVLGPSLVIANRRGATTYRLIGGVTT
jgi:hypothetical protein